MSYWFTTKQGKHIFVDDGQSPMDAFIRSKGESSLQKEHKNKIKELNNDKYKDGTYDLDTMKSVNFDSGYQVSFYQTGVKLNDNEYRKAHNDMIKYSDGKTYAGKFGGEPEISYHIRNINDAKMLMKKYNQHSIAQFTKTGKVRFYYNYELDEEKNKTTYKRGGHK